MNKALMKKLSTLLCRGLRSFGLPFSILLVVTLIAALGSDLAHWLRYDRDAILSAGEYWRILSGHFVHLTWSHLGMNALGLVLIWLLFGALLSSVEWLLVIVFGSALTSAGLLSWNPDLIWYVGFSGVLHTLFVVGCLFDIPLRRLDGKILLLAVAIKLAVEQYSGPLPGSEATAGGKVIVDAHLYGALCGLLLAPILYGWRILRRDSSAYDRIGR